MIDVVGSRTLRDLIRERAERHPDKDFLVFEDRAGQVTTCTYAELLRNVERVAQRFRDLGVGKGDAVVLHLSNCPEFLYCWLGLAWSGAVAVPSNTANTLPELVHVVGFSEAVAVITSPGHKELVESARAGLPAVRHVVLARDEAATPGTVRIDDWLGTAPVSGDREDPAVAAEDVAQMVFTSGTTSRPKAVLLTHANYLHSGEREARCSGVDQDDRLITALPLFHVNAQSNTVLAALSVGGTCILLEEYRATKFWSQVRRHRATAVSLVAMQLRTLLAQPTAATDRDHAVRRNIYAINVSDAEKESFEYRFGLELVNGYGLSEAMTIVTAAPVFGEKRWPSIGLPASDRTIRIVDEAGADCPPGVPGELLVSGVPGRTLMKGYFKDPVATAEAMSDGWLRTGDNAFLDEKGYVYFYDRRKDIIKRAGENISASEVESVLVQHAAVAEAAVIGVADPIRDEAVKAFVVLEAGAALSEEEIVAHCRDQLAGFKVPTIVEFLPALPKTSIGKIEKKLLRQASETAAPA